MKQATTRVNAVAAYIAAGSEVDDPTERSNHGAGVGVRVGGAQQKLHRFGVTRPRRGVHGAPRHQHPERTKRRTETRAYVRVRQKQLHHSGVSVLRGDEHG